MTTMLEFHNQAMDFVTRATLSLEPAPENESSRRELFQQALDLELKAIEILEQQEFHSLTYSLIHRSAASVALESGDFELAEKLASKTIARGADPSIVRDLREISGRAATNQTLREHGIQILDNDIEMSVDGPAITDDGMIPLDGLARPDNGRGKFHEPDRPKRRFQTAGFSFAPQSRKFCSFDPIGFADRYPRRLQWIGSRSRLHRQVHAINGLRQSTRPQFPSNPN